MTVREQVNLNHKRIYIDWKLISPNIPDKQIELHNTYKLKSVSHVYSETYPNQIDAKEISPTITI